MAVICFSARTAHKKIPPHEPQSLTLLLQVVPEELSGENKKKAETLAVFDPLHKALTVIFLSEYFFERNRFTDRVYTLLRCVSAPLGPSYRPLPVRLPKRYSVFNSYPRFRSRLQAAFYCLVHRTSWFSRRIPPGWGMAVLRAGLIIPRYDICLALGLEL